jgi:hypothetical protein
MQCLICGEPMRVVMVEPHDVIQVSGFELRTYQCVGCGDVEKRMSFGRPLPQDVVPLVPQTVEMTRTRETTKGHTPSSGMKTLLGSLMALVVGKSSS